MALSVLAVGSTYLFSFSFNQTDVEQFAVLTGDTNPIHLNADYAAQAGFDRPVMHGFLAGSVVSRVLGTQFPGEGTVLVKQELEFRRPMFAGVAYEAQFTVREIQTGKHRAAIETTIADPAGKQTLRGLATVINKSRF